MTAPDNLWFGLLVRKGTPEDVVKKLSDAIAKTVQEKETKDLYAKLMFIDAYLDGNYNASKITRFSSF